jgi:hypothetical protein
LAAAVPQADEPCNEQNAELDYNPGFPEKPSTWSFVPVPAAGGFPACPFI